MSFSSIKVEKRLDIGWYDIEGVIWGALSPFSVIINFLVESISMVIVTLIPSYVKSNYISTSCSFIRLSNDDIIQIYKK